VTANKDDGSAGSRSRRKLSEVEFPGFLLLSSTIPPHLPEQEAQVKRVILGVAVAAATATTAVVVPSVAGATGGSTGGDSVVITQYADYNLSGLSLDLGLQVRCTGGTGTVTGNVEQYPPETPSPVSLSAGNSLVVCDGKTHAVGLTVDGAGFDNGKAKATVMLTVPTTLKTTTVTKWITIMAH
jgi:hypothetical protein